MQAAARCQSSHLGRWYGATNGHAGKVTLAARVQRTENSGVKGNEQTGTVGQPIPSPLSHDFSAVVVGASRGFVGLQMLV